MKTLLTAVALTLAMALPATSGPKPQAPATIDVSNFNEYLQYTERMTRKELESMGCTDPFKTTISKASTVVIVIDECFADILLQTDGIYPTLWSMRDDWNHMIGWRYRTGISLRASSGGWLGGIDTNTGQYTPPNIGDQYGAYYY